MIDIITYFIERTGFTPTEEQKQLLLALTDDSIKNLIVTAGRGFSKTLCCAIAILWYAEKSLEDGPINLMIVSAQDAMYTYVNDYFNSEALIQHRVKKGVYTEVPVEGFELDNGTKVATKPATAKVRSNRADVEFLDECADIPEGVIKSAMGCLKGDVNRLILISTCHKSGYFTTRAMNPKKYNYDVLQFSSETCPWLKQTVERAKNELTKAEYAMEVLGRAPTKEERGTYPHKNIERCLMDDVKTEGGQREAGLDFAYEPCKTVLYITEKNGVRRKDLYYKAWAKKPIEDIAPEIADIIESYNCVIIKADANPPHYKGHIEKHTKTPIVYLEGRMHKAAMIGQMKRKLLQKQVEIDRKHVKLVKQLRSHRRNMRTGDDIHDAFIMSCYDSKETKNIRNPPAIYIDGVKYG